MHVEDTSPPRDTDTHAAQPTATDTTLNHVANGQPSSHGRKRKRATVAASSPAPSDAGSASGAPNPSEFISSRADLSSRPRLSISRGPIFIQTAEGSEYFKTDLVGVNRIGFRYVPAGINPPGYAQPFRTIESSPTTYRVSWEDRSPFIKATKDGLGLAGSKGFRSARCNAPMTEGKWYMEVKILHGGGERVVEDGRRDGSHVRLGWGRREAPLNGPVGLDGYSYGYRDKTGDKATLSRPKPYGKHFGTGDVIGMYISLPQRRQPNKKDHLDPAHIKRERIPIDLKGQEVFEILEYPQSKEMAALMDYSTKATSAASLSLTAKKPAGGKLPERGGPSTATKSSAPQLRPLPILQGSRIAFFVNGECQGTAFQDIYDYLQLRQTTTSQKAKEKKRAREGIKEHRENPYNDGWLGYYPFISLFNDACVRLNPGPDFDYPPPPDIDDLLDGRTNEAADTDVKERTWRPACERYAEFMAEQWAMDTQEEEETRLEAAQSAAAERAEAEKRAQRAKKRQEVEARKRAKKAADQVAADEDRFGPAVSVLLAQGQPSPSPLRHAATYDAEDIIDNNDSPVPTFISNGDPHGGPSGYTTDNAEIDRDNGQEQGGLHVQDMSPMESIPHSPRDPASLGPVL